MDAGDPASSASQRVIEQAAGILRAGGIVAFPTETVYGLGANALNAKAVAKIFEAKQRPAWDPLIVHIANAAMVSDLALQVPENARRLMEAFWPGPLTLLLPKSPRIPDIVTASLPRVGLRMPAHPVAHALLAAAGLPVAAPSANRFGRTSPTRADHVAEDLDGRIDAILDAGETTHGVESTVVAIIDGGVEIYRPGVITLEQIRSICTGAVSLHSPGVAEESLSVGAESPGLSVRHYAPRARLMLIEGEGKEQRDAFAEAARQCEDQGDSVGLMLPDAFQTAVIGRQARVFRWGKWADQRELAQRLFAGLRWLDADGATVIVCPVPPGEGIAVAIRDRLRKAARR